jgi:hypothetical protein
MDDIVIGWRRQVMARTMTIFNYIWNCGLYYGYEPCCIKNYINLHKLGLHPAMFMSVILGHDNRANHVLCPICDEAWTGHRAEPQYNLRRQDVVDDMKEYKQMRDNL